MVDLCMWGAFACLVLVWVPLLLQQPCLQEWPWDLSNICVWRKLHPRCGLHMWLPTRARSQPAEWWNKTMWLLRQEKLILDHNKRNYGTEKDDLLGQEQLLLGHNEASYGTNNVNVWDRRSQYWVIMRSILGQNEVTFWDRRSWNQIIRRRIMGQNKITFGDRRSWY